MPGNNEPAATGIPDQVNLDADAAISVSVAGSFSDPDSDTLTFVADGLPPGLSMDANGNITGTIDHAASQGGDFLDGVYQVTVYADDGKGGVAMQTFEWKVTNPVPVANPDTVDTSYVTPVIVDLLANDSDPDGDILSVVSATVPAGQGTVAFNGTDWVFTPAAGFTGTATISYTITDAEGAQAMSTHDVVIGPGAINDTYGTPHETAVNGDVKSGDFYLPASVFTKTSDPANGTVVYNADGTYTYTPNAGFTGVDTFNYLVTDPNGQTATATETLHVGPKAVNDGYTTPYITTVNGDVKGADIYLPGSTFTKTSDPANGTVVYNADGTYAYTPNTGFTGIDTFNYLVTDPNGQTATATETITIGPGAINDTYGTPHETAVNGDVKSGDFYLPASVFTKTSDPANGTVVYNADGTYTYTPNAGFTGVDTFNYLVTDPNGQTATATETITVGAQAVDDIYRTPFETAVNGDVKTSDIYTVGSVFTKTSDPANGTVVYNADGTFTYTPNAGFTGTDTFTYMVTAPDGQTSSATETIHVGPDAADDGYTTAYVTGVIGNAAVGDTYLPGSTFTKATNPANGTVTMNANGTYTYTPNAGFTGIDTFTYTITDPNGQTATAAETITVGPGAVNDAYTTPFQTAVNGDVKASDVYLPGSVFTKTSDPANGTLVYNADGTFTYTPNAGFTGTDTFTYLVTAPSGQTSTATETITVSPPLLIAVSDKYTTAYNTPLNGNAAAGDTFFAGSTFQVVTPPAKGTVTMTPDGLYIFKPAAGFAGTVTFTYRVTDPTGASKIATETIIVRPPLVAAVNHTYLAPIDKPFTGNASLGNKYPTGSVFSIGTKPAHGTVTMRPDGTFVYKPYKGFRAVDTFTYKIKDPTGRIVTATETIRISPRTIIAQCLTTFGNLTGLIRPR